MNQKATLASKIRKNEQPMPYPMIDANTTENDLDNQYEQSTDELENNQDLNQTYNEAENKNLAREENSYNAFDKAKNAIKEATKEASKEFFNKIFAKYKWYIIGIGAGVFLLFIIILLCVYSGNGRQLELVDFNSSSSSSGSNGDIDNSGINNDNPLLSRSLITTIGADKYNEINTEVLNSIETAGACTKEGAAMATYTLITSLQKEGVKIPYYWGGGHDKVFIGVDPDLGAFTDKACSEPTTCYEYKGYDCSGLVSWSITNSINNGLSYISSTPEFMKMGDNVSFNEASQGDIVVKDGHVMQVIQNNGTTLLVAEAVGGSSPGVILSSYDESYLNSRDYQIRNITSFFEGKC